MAKEYPIEAMAKGFNLMDASEMSPEEVLEQVNIVKASPPVDVPEDVDAKRQMFDNRARDEFIVKYHSAGMTEGTIAKMVKAKAQEKGWRPVGEWTIRTIIVEYYKKRRDLLRGVDGRENEKAMQDATLEQQAKFLERLVMCYDKNDKNNGFKSMFDRVQLGDLIHRMRQQYIENKNWNESRKNPLVVAESNVFEVNLFEKTGEKMLTEGKSEAMENVLDHLRRKLDGSNAVEDDYVEAEYQEEGE